jgi:hypothetical protein
VGSQNSFFGSGRAPLCRSAVGPRADGTSIASRRRSPFDANARQAGPDDGYGVKNARTTTIEPNEQGSVSPAQIQLVWRTLPQDIDLMPQYQDFGFQPPSRLEAVAQHPDEKEANCNHQPQSCSDSVMAATPADGLFGSDRTSHPARDGYLCLPQAATRTRNRSAKRCFSVPALRAA